MDDFYSLKWEVIPEENIIHIYRVGARRPINGDLAVCGHSKKNHEDNSPKESTFMCSDCLYLLKTPLRS
jgi:hypothetical protein